MKPPTRLLDDPSIDPTLRGALESEALREVPFDLTAGLAELKSSIATGSAAKAAGAAGIKLKLIAGGGGLAVAALVGYSIARSDPPPPPLPSPKEPAPVVAAPPPVVTAPPAPTIEPSAAAPTPSAAPKLDRRARLAEEVKHLGEVRRLLASNPAAAAAKADEGHAKFNGGMLYQEREAVAISALARAGRGGEARTRAGAFLKRFPTSPLADQVRAAAGLPAE